MSLTQGHKCVATRDESAVEQTLERVSDGNGPAQRVLEYVREERDASELRTEDWFDALEAVTKEAGRDLVLYSEQAFDDFPASATIYGVDWRGNGVQQTWNAATGESRAGVNRDDIDFAGDSGRPREVLTLAEANRRIQRFAAENGGGE